MSSFLLAVQFLTVIPIRFKDVDEGRMAESAVYFPLVGLFIGLALCGINFGLTALNFNSFAASIILVVSLILLTGGMHLDGLSDTTDAFLSHKPKEEMLAIMRDPHIGVMGVLSIISSLLLKVGLIYSLNSSLRFTALLLMCGLSRWVAVLAMFLFPYARNNGKAKVFIRGMNNRIFFIALASTFIFSFLIWQFKGLFILFIISGCAYLLGRLAKKIIGGITGDILGAIIELAEISVLFISCTL